MHTLFSKGGERFANRKELYLKFPSQISHLSMGMSQVKSVFGGKTSMVLFEKSSCLIQGQSI